MAAIFGERKFFLKIPIAHFLDTLWVENFDEVALSRTVKEIEANLCFSIFSKNLKIQNGRHFWEEENFLKIAISTFLNYPGGRKISTKSLYQGDRSKFVFFQFWQKFENSKWPSCLGRAKLFEVCQKYKITNSTFLRSLWVENFDKIALFSTVKKIEANLCFSIFDKNSKWPPFWGRGKFF